MKRTISILFFFSLFGLLFAQHSENAKSLMDKAYASYEASNGIKLSFKSIMTDKAGKEFTPQSGDAYIKGDKFKLEMETTDIWFDGTTQWVLMKDVNEVNISAPSGTEVASVSPLALLGMYKNGFTLKKPISKTIDGKNAYLIEMTPVNQNKDFKLITAAIEKNTGHIIQVVLEMTDGMKNVITISGYNTNHQFNDSTFIFDKNKYPKVDIIDLR